MNKNWLALIFLPVFLLSVSPAGAQEAEREWLDGYDSRWYLSGGAGIMRMDRAREARPGGFNYGVGVGRFFTPNLSLDLELDRTRAKYRRGIVGADQSDTYRLASAGVVGRYHFTEGPTRPYAAFGVGQQRHSHALDRGTNWFGSLGLGVMSRVTDSVSTRLELGYRYDRDKDSIPRQRSFGDWLVTGSVQFRLGSPRYAPRPEPAPEPEPERTPPPPPPEPEPEPDPEPEVIFEFDSAVTFEFDSAQLRPGARAALNEAAAMLNEDDAVRDVEVAGHTCDIGSASYNQGLSERRAQAVRDYLVNEGNVDPDRLTVRGYGEDQPRVANDSDENRQMNRRVELTVRRRN